MPRSLSFLRALLKITIIAAAILPLALGSIRLVSPGILDTGTDDRLPQPDGLPVEKVAKDWTEGARGLNSPWLVDLERRAIEPQNISIVLPEAWRSDVNLGNQIGSVTQVQPPPELETEDNMYSFSIYNITKWEKEFR